MSYDTETLAALASGSIVMRDLLTVKGKTLGGSAATFAYWNGEDDAAISVTPAGGGTPESRGFVGSSLLDVPPVIDAIGLEARSVTLGLDHISTALGSPMDMVYGNNVRVGRVELHRALFDPATWNLVAEPILLLAGRVDGAEVNDAAADSDGGLSLDVVGSAIDLTRTNPAMESDEQQRRRSGDRFRRYGDTAAQVETWWGQAKS